MTAFELSESQPYSALQELAAPQVARADEPLLVSPDDLEGILAPMSVQSEVPTEALIQRLNQTVIVGIQQAVHDGRGVAAVTVYEQTLGIGSVGYGIHLARSGLFFFRI